MYTKKRIKLALLFGLVCSSSLCMATEPPNLVLTEQAVEVYAASGEYLSDVNKQIVQAEQYLQERVTENSKLKQPKRLAVVLDIDETSLSNLPFLLANKFHYPLSKFKQYGNRANAPAMQATLSLYNLAKQDHVAVFFVTGRKSNQVKVTTANLLKAGYKNWDGLYMEPVVSHYTSAANFKAPIREKIENMGYDIVLNIGDQNSDLKGGYADNAVKLPNPFYYVP